MGGPARPSPGRLRAGEPRAFEELVIAYQHRVFGVALRMLGSRAEAEEGAPEAVLRAPRARRGAEARGAAARRRGAELRGDRRGARPRARHRALAPAPGADGPEGKAGAVPRMTCHDARELFSALLDEALAADERPPP